MDTKEMLEQERRSMGRGCELIRAHEINAGDDAVTLLVYRVEPLDMGGLGKQHHIRWAVFIKSCQGSQGAPAPHEYRQSSSGVVSTWFERPRGG